VKPANLLGASRRRRRVQLATSGPHSSSPYYWVHPRRRTQRHYFNTCIRSGHRRRCKRLCLNPNAKCCPELFAGLDQPQSLPTGERAGRCGHWLQRDEVSAFWRKYLCVTVILKKLQSNTTAISRQRECRMFVENSEAGVKVEVAESKPFLAPNACNMAADGRHLHSSGRHVHVGCAARDQHRNQHDWRCRRTCQEEAGGKMQVQEPSRAVLGAGLSDPRYLGARCRRTLPPWSTRVCPG